MDRTQGDRAKNEPKSTAGDDSWDVKSNYLFCPTLCRTCEYFSEVNSNWPYHCKGTSDRAVSHKSKRENYKQYDHCEIYEEKKKPVETPVVKSSSNDDEYERKRIASEEERNRKEAEREEKELKRQSKEEEKRRAIYERHEYDRTHCFYCDGCDEEENLVRLLGKSFHEKCLNEFKNSDKGKEWIHYKEQENLYLDNLIKAEKIVENNGFNNVYELLRELNGIDTNYHCSKEEYEEAFRKLNIDEFSRFVENKKAQLEKEKEEEEFAIKDEEEKQKIQHKVKRPIFILVLAFSILWILNPWLNPSYNVVLSLPKSILALGIVIILLFIYYKMITGSINWLHDELKKDVYKEIDSKQTQKFNRFIYALFALIPTVIYGGIFFLIIKVILKL